MLLTMFINVMNDYQVVYAFILVKQRLSETPTKAYELI
jgi:hypothetical protein